MGGQARHLEQGEVRGPRDIPDDACCSLNPHVQERGGDGCKGCILGPGPPRGPALPHEAGPGAHHDRPHVCKVHVHQARHLHTMRF